MNNMTQKVGIMIWTQKIWILLGPWGWGKLTDASSLCKCFHLPPLCLWGWRIGKDVIIFVEVQFVLLPLLGMMDGYRPQQRFFHSVELCHLALFKNTKELHDTNHSVHWWNGEIFHEMLLYVYFPKTCWVLFSLAPKFFISISLTILTSWEVELQMTSRDWLVSPGWHTWSKISMRN